MNSLIPLGALNMALAVTLGAFGAHGLKTRLSVEQLAWWHTGVEYHFLHALGLLLIGVLATTTPALPVRSPGLLLLAGIVIFSGTLYAMALGAPRGFGAITPIGGSAFIAGWLILAWQTWKLAP